MAVLGRLRTVREEHALTQEELAEKAGVSRGTIINLEQGNDARPPTVRKLAEALGVKPKELMESDAAPAAR
jgi:transcriptional regulator with XRE-family HTH domain